MNTRPVGSISRSLMALSAALVGLSAGCADEAVSPPDEASAQSNVLSTYALPDTRHTRGVHVFENVKRLDDRAAQAVYIDGDRLRFPVALRDALAGYEAGDIMATSMGEGLLREVLEVERVGPEIVVHTREATLDEVFASGEIYVATHAEPHVPTPQSFQYAPLEPGADLGVARQALDASWDGELFSWNRDFAADLNAAINSQHFKIDEASISAAIGAEFYIDAGPQLFPPSVDINTVRAGVNGNANATLRVRLESSDSFSYDETIYLASSDPGNNPLLALPSESVDVAGLVRIDFAAHSWIDLNVAAGGTIYAEGEISVSGNLRGGLERKNGAWQTYSGAGIEPSGYAPAFGGQKTFTARAQLTNSVDVTASNAATGYLTIKPATLTVDFSQRINADTGQCPNRFNVNVKGEVEGQLQKVSVLGFDFDIMSSPSSWTIYDKNYMTEQGQLEFAGICDPNYTPPSFGQGDAFEGQMCTADEDCATGIACFRETCVREGPLRFSVAWFADTDVDLELETPSGEIINWRNFAQGGRDGFEYDFPQCTGECVGSSPYVESIFARADAEPGTYRVHVIHHEARSPSNFALTIVDGGDVRHEGGKLPGEGERVTFDYTVR